MNAICNRTLAALVAAAFSSAACGAVINEIFVNDAGSDTNEFIELFGQPGESLDGLSLIVMDNDNGGDTASSAFRRVNVQFDLITQTIPDDGYFVIGAGPDLAGVVDFPASFVGQLQNGSQTYALVRSGDIIYDPMDNDELTQASVDLIAANAIDIIETWDEDPADLFDFSPRIMSAGGVEAASRIPNGIDTDTAGDWQVVAASGAGFEVGDRPFFTPGEVNFFPEPSAALMAMGFAAAGLARSRRINH